MPYLYEYFPNFAVFVSFVQMFLMSNADDIAQEKNRSLNSSILTLSSQLGQFQVHEEELSSMLKLKVALLPLGLYYSTMEC